MSEQLKIFIFVIVVIIIVKACKPDNNNSPSWHMDAPAPLPTTQPTINVNLPPGFHADVHRHENVVDIDVRSNATP